MQGLCAENSRQPMLGSQDPNKHRGTMPHSGPADLRQFQGGHSKPFFWYQLPDFKIDTEKQRNQNNQNNWGKENEVRWALSLPAMETCCEPTVITTVCCQQKGRHVH